MPGCGKFINRHDEEELKCGDVLEDFWGPDTAPYTVFCSHACDPDFFLDCYQCGTPDEPVKRKVLSEFLGRGSDPTVCYNLACGHIAI